MTHNNYNALIKSAKTCARNVGITFLDEYLKGPFAQELSENKKIFLRMSLHKKSAQPDKQ